jgi:hypothetical protein
METALLICGFHSRAKVFRKSERLLRHGARDRVPDGRFDIEFDLEAFRPDLSGC